MQRHGYKGAFELAATVDYLFGFDATAGVVTDWMYAQLAENYVLDKDNQDFMKHANPWRCAASSRSSARLSIAGFGKSRIRS